MIERSEHTHPGRRFVCGQPLDTALQVSGVAISILSVKTEHISMQSSWIAFPPLFLHLMPFRLMHSCRLELCIIVGHFELFTPSFDFFACNLQCV